MRRIVPTSRRVGLTRHGKHIRMYPDTVERLRELAQLRGKPMAVVADEAICAALQREYDESPVAEDMPHIGDEA